MAPGGLLGGCQSSAGIGTGPALPPAPLPFPHPPPSFSPGQRCGAVFTSVLYVEQWCEEQFGRPTLGAIDFRDADTVSQQHGWQGGPLREVLTPVALSDAPPRGAAAGRVQRDERARWDLRRGSLQQGAVPTRPQPPPGGVELCAADRGRAAEGGGAGARDGNPGSASAPRLSAPLPDPLPDPPPPPARPPLRGGVEDGQVGHAPPPPTDQSYHAALYTCLKARGDKDEHAFSSSLQRAQEVGPTPLTPLQGGAEP